MRERKYDPGSLVIEHGRFWNLINCSEDAVYVGIEIIGTEFKLKYACSYGHIFYKARTGKEIRLDAYRSI